MYSSSKRPRISDIRKPPEGTFPDTSSPRSLPWEPRGFSLAPPVREETPLSPYQRFSRPSPRPRLFVWVALFLVILLAGWGSIEWGLSKKERVTTQAEAGFYVLSEALGHLERHEFEGAREDFEKVKDTFAAAEETLGVWGKVLKGFRNVPGLSKLASASYALESGENLALSGMALSQTAGLFFVSSESPLGGEVSFLNFLKEAKEPLSQARRSLENAEQSLQKVKIGDLPADKQGQFQEARSHVSTLLGALTSFQEHEELWEELLGDNGPRKYLFLLQNNHELRATGGFIGSYGLLDVNAGVVRRFFVDGIFNPDGQLKENIVPPKPIQKISAGWSLHDSNWFPDFPTSAEKAIFFYEKTGGPTVDGVITLTPTIMQKLLRVTGPIALPEYGLEVDAENFMPVIQEEVELNYDKETNEPKKILADLSLILLEKVFAIRDKAALSELAQALVEGLNEKHMLLYMRHPETQALIERAGWSGKIAETQKDYLSVIHTNINGYKTDGVISEDIRHEVTIGDDGSVIDTLTITRRHHGGGTPYDWWNRVNADYLRVYVPRGSELLSVEGTTWEFPEAPLDYEALGFREDEDIRREESTMKIDEKSGTRISEDAGKTVFGAWVYVSPQEEVTVKMRYRLPFRLDLEKIRTGEADSYTVLYQKQAGSPGSKLESTVAYPEDLSVIWQTGANLIPYERKAELHTTLRADAYLGVVFGALEK